ncbi:hypothetical protein LguiA_013903 [Lonicera macranthoides]
MAVSSSPFGLQSHVRSISLPSRLKPNCTKVESVLNKIKTRACCSSKESIQAELVGLAELYTLVQELLQSPLTQQVLAQHQNGSLVEESLEGSIGLLDFCGAIRDLISSMKQHVQELQSALRRKGGDLSVENNVSAYLTFRKSVKKEVNRNLKALTQVESKVGSSLGEDLNHHLSTVNRVLREVTAVTISVFRSLLLFLSVRPAKMASRWSLITNLMMTGSTSSDRREMIVNELESVDLAIYSLRGCIRNNDSNVDVQMALRGLHTVDATIESLEGGLDLLFRRLIQSRISFLNILTV